MAGLGGITLGNFTELHYGPSSETDIANLSAVGDVQQVGDLTDEATIVDVQAYGQKYLKKLVGSSNASPIELTCNYDPNDAGQTDLLLAYTSTTTRKVALVMNEDEAGTNGHYNMFEALIASASISNSFDETRTMTFSIVPTNGLGEYTAKA